MRTDAVWIIIWGLLKIILLTALVVLGILMIPGGFIDRIEHGVDTAVNFFKNEAHKAAPGVAQDAAQQTEETKNDIQNLYQQVKDKYYPGFIDWIAQTVKRF